ncbi:MAG: thrombospondin type 3 repeat-containing protein, partial [bacterium]
GQARWLLTNAACELESRLPGGAGHAVWQQVQMSGTNGFNAVNVGQLKHLAAGLYTRLMEEGVAVKWPWNEGVSGDYAPATVGQAKHLFAFEVSGAGFTPSINGTVGYSGLQTGPVHVVAVPASGTNFSVETSLATTGVYHVVVGPVPTTWHVTAWCDSNGNNLRESWEAQGEQVEPSLVVTAVVRNINVVLSDPDEDGDGIPGYLERLLGLDPYYAEDALSDTDGDGLTLAEELRYGCNPAAGDSDGDGMGDGAEVLNGLSPSNGLALASLPFLEAFETPLAAGGLSGQHGWSASAPARVIPVLRPGLRGAQCLSLAGGTNEIAVASHPLAAYRVGRLWIDFLAAPVWRQSVITEPPAASSVAAFYINRAGRVVVFDRTWPPGQWSVVTNDSGVVSGGVVRLTVQLDYSRRRWGLWLNGTNLLGGLPFSGTATELARVRFTGAAYADTLLDEIAVTSNAPPDLTPDSDADGLPDEWELAQGLDPYDPSDASADPDHDGLSNRAEYGWGANPRDADTDHDGWSDGVEAAAGQSVTNADPRVAATVPFMEPFEAPAVLPGDIGGQHGWFAAPSNWAMVQSSNKMEGLQALQLLPSTNAALLRQRVKGVLGRETWTDWRAIPARRDKAGVPAVSPDSTAAFFINSGGWPVVLNGTNSVTLTNVLPAAATNWIRFTVHQDFSNQVWSLYWNGRPAATGLRMAHALNQYTGLRVSGGVNNSAWLDDIRVTEGAPGDIDTDGDGLPNDWELEYGFNPDDPADGSDMADADRDGLSNADEFQRLEHYFHSVSTHELSSVQ